MQLDLQHSKYRPDIDGLRAIAVLSVVGFHAFPARIRGGYVGVDVFFVISGFLISTIIMGALERERFSYLDFYSRRIRRIFPALLLVLGCSLLLGWFVLLADEFKQLAKHTAGSTLFISNFLLWGEAGYFDTAAELKPFLHLWSLAIEEQFYIFWPMLLGLVWRRKWNFLTVTITIGGASFLLNMMVVGSNPIAAFYSPLSRIWELMVGGLLAYLLIHRPAILGRYSNAQSVMGLCLLALGITLFDSNTPFPSWRALLPTIGAFLIISAGSASWVNRILLASKPMVWFGLISYPLYLWHWPALAFARILNAGTPNAAVRGGAVMFSVVAAFLTYQFIEVKFRNHQCLAIKTWGMVVIALIGLVLGATIYVNQGLPNRAISERVASSAGANFVYHLPFPTGITTCEGNASIEIALQPHCHQYVVKTGAPTLAVWGDSSSGAWSYMFYKLAEKHSFNVILISHPSCPPLIGVRKSFHHHPESHKYCADASLGNTVLRSLASLKPQAIVLIGAWNGYSYYEDRRADTNEYITTEPDTDADAASSIAALRRQIPLTVRALDGIANVLVFNSWPKLSAAPSYRLNRLPFLQTNARTPLKSAAQHAKESEVANDALGRELASGRTRRTRNFDPATKLCDAVCAMSLDGIGLYGDAYHITSSASFLFSDDVWAVLGPMLVKP